MTPPAPGVGHGQCPKGALLGPDRPHLTKAGDPGLREALFLAADLARKVDPTLAERYHHLVVDQGRHHTSAVCTLAAVMATRIAACWRRGELYVLRDVDGNEITDAQGRAICAERYKVSAEVRAARKRAGAAQNMKRRAGRGGKESTKAAPASDPPDLKATTTTRVA